MKTYSIQGLFIAILALCVAGCNSGKQESISASGQTVKADSVFMPSTIELRAIKMTSRQGLPDNSVRKIYQDSKGFIWFGTMNGLCRYDGTRFVTLRKQDGGITLQDNKIRNLIEDKNGYLWVSTTSEVFSCYDLRNDRFVDYTGNGNYKRRYGRWDMAANGDVWLSGRQHGAMRVVHGDDGFSTELFGKNNLGTDEVNFVAAEEGDTVFIGTGKGLFVHTGGTLRKLISGHAFVCYARRNGVYSFVASDGSVFTNRNGRQTIAGRLPFTAGEKTIGALSLSDRVVVFTIGGSYYISMKTGQTGRSTGVWNMSGVTIHTDNTGDKWLSDGTGRLRMVDGDNLRELQMMPGGRTGFFDLERYYIVRDRRGLVWIGTYGNGLFVYNVRTQAMQHFKAGLDADSHIASDYVLSLMADRSGSVWVGTEYTGLSHLFVMNEGINRLLPENGGGLDRSNSVRMITRVDGQIMVGTRTGGLYAYTPDMEAMTGKEYYDMNIYAMCKGPDGKVWKGTKERGLFIGDTNYTHTDNPASIAHNSIFCMLKDRKNRMWIGTFGGGMDLAVPQHDGTYTFRHFLQRDREQKSVRCLYEDKSGWIWAGTSGGVFVFHPDSIIANPKAYYSYTSANGALPTDETRFIMQDHTGRIWLAMPGSGIAVCTVGKEGYGRLGFTIYGREEGLVSTMAQAIVEDRNHTLWISTELGVSHLNPQSNMFENYFFSQGIIGNVYSQNSALLLDNGNVLFGTNYGLVSIDPASVYHAANGAEVTFTDLKIDGISVRPSDDDSPIDGSLSYVDKIELEASQNSFVIDFSTFDYSDDNSTQYSYRLDNYDNDWSAPSTETYAAYKNLSPGRYRLHAKACNALGVWGKESVIDIVVHPPFYLTLWAFLFYAIVVAVTGFFVLRTMRKMNNLRNRIRLEESLTKYKLTFFTNISHEFRTPLTLIQGSLEKIYRSGKMPKELMHSVAIMDKSTRRMLRLINQLLEFRKMQNNKLTLALRETDVVALVRGIFDSFADAAESKNIDYRFNSTAPMHTMYVDVNHIDKIVYNLLSNAFKYTPGNGRITLSMIFDDEARKLTVKVADTGVGIPKEKQDELFSRFMQSNYTGDSFGIGLHLTRELVNVHKGTIRYEENPGGGSVFVVVLPTDAAVYDCKDFLVAGNAILKEEEQHEKEVSELMNGSVEDEERNEEATPLNKRKILLIEDDNDVREFLREELSVYFEVVAEADGPSGMERAKEYDADLIVSDVMMPGMDGFEVTRRLKTDFATSHIPIILLTALDSSEKHLEGVESGADAYITKPFSPKLLLTRIFKLIEQRDRLKEKFSNDIKTVRPTLCTTGQDKEFADRMTAIIERELSNSQFSVDRFAELMNMGRTVFFRKVKGVTGYTPNEYIRILRMKRAAELLLANELTVSEISYKVGIDDPFYFSKCFKKQFGVPPSVYQKGGGDGAASASDGEGA